MPEASAEDRGIAACSDAERRYATELAQELRDIGRDVRVLPVWVRPAWWLPLAACAAVAVIASALAVDYEVLGLALAVGALLIALVDLTTGALASRVGPARATQVVVATPPPRRGRREVTVILTASTDDRRRGQAAFLPVSLAPATLTVMALLTALLAARAAGAEGRGLDIVQLLPTLALLAAIALLLDAGRAPLNPRRRDATRAVIAAAAALDADPPPRVDVAVVLAGAGDVHAAGLSAWLRARRRRGLDPAGVAIVHLEGGDAAGSWREREGIVLPLMPHRQLLAAARRAGELHAAAAPRRDDVSAAGVIGAHGWPAITIGPHAAFAERLVRELDTELGEPPA